jgi:hypothetical protein
LLRAGIIFALHLIRDGIEISLFTAYRRGSYSTFITLEFLQSRQRVRG